MNTFEKHIRGMVADHRRHNRYIVALCAIALLVAIGVAKSLERPGFAYVSTQTVLDCHYAGNGAHQHNADCYDDNGNLVCPLPEREAHVHDDSCYDEEGNLICGLEEITEEHVHGPGCFVTVTVDEGELEADDPVEQGAGSVQVDAGSAQADASPTQTDSDPVQTDSDPVQTDASPTQENAGEDAAMPAQSFSHQFKDADGVLQLRVDVAAPEGALPKGTTMEASWVDPDALTAKEREAVDRAVANKVDGLVVSQQAVDITFRDAEGNKIEPALDVVVTFTSPMLDTKDLPVVVHVDDLTEEELEEQQRAIEEQGKTVEEAEPTREAQAIDELTERELEKHELVLGDGQIAVESGQFSTYVLIVTSLRHEMRSEGETVVVTVDAPAAAGIPADATVQVTEISQGSAEHAAYETGAAGALGVESSKVALARFFDIKIVDGQGNELQPAEGVKVSIELADAPTEADGASVVHFDSTSGEPEVVDASENAGMTTFEAQGFSVYGVVYTVVIGPEDDGVYRFEGEDYAITITCPEEANIPVGTKLVVSELDPESDAYLQRLGQLWMEKNKNYLEQEERRQKGDPESYEDDRVNPVNINAARIFDITLSKNGEAVEPDVPVLVEVSYKEGLEFSEGATVGVVHYLNDGIELIDEVETTVSDNAVTNFAYEQASFSDSGTYIAQETHDLEAEPKASAVSFRAVGSGRTLAEPTANKTLTPNVDGTYTLELDVTGSEISSSETDINKSNVLIVMDRSSSMKTNNAPNSYEYTPYTGNPRNGVTYYGYVNNSYIALNRTNSNRWYYTVGGQTYYYDGTIYTRAARNRLQDEQAALVQLIGKEGESGLLGKNDPSDNDKKDIIEVKVISFASGRTDNDRKNNFKRNNHQVYIDNNNTPVPSNYFVNTESDWLSTDSVLTAVNDSSVAKGTNWQEALQYAKEVADQKKAEQPDEPVYVIFLTDGEPTDILGDNGNAQYSGSTTQKENCLKAAEPDAKRIVDPHTVIAADGTEVTTDHRFYGIFTYGNDDLWKGYLRRLVNYAYGKGDVSTEGLSGGAGNYYYDANNADALLSAFQNIFTEISNTLGYGSVKITDGMTSGAMTTTLVDGKTDGFRYSVKGLLGAEIYSVTATGSDNNPSVTFTIGNTTYSGNQVEKKTDSNGRTYYSVTVGTGESAIEYKMALADYSYDEANNKKAITWDLSSIGTLRDGWTYAVSTVVWPNQDAYDYVAGLNNKLPGYTWDDTAATPVRDGNNNILYYKGGVASQDSIVKYPNGVYAVLTNTEQKLTYREVKTETVNGVTTVTEGDPKEITLPTPEPMPLTASKSSIQKIWNIDRDPSILAALLYPADGSHYKLQFDITEDAYESQSSQGEGTGSSSSVYTSVNLGWDDEQNKYVWDEATVQQVPYGDVTVPVGTTWAGDFSIATGMMLSEARMDALGLNKGDYDCFTLGEDGPTYYILETGHDYTIVEHDKKIGYEFDFESPVYHPMKVDGVLKNVTFTRNDAGAITGIAKMENIAVSADGTSTLTVENTLRGYLHVNKIVVDMNGAQVPGDNTKFTYTVTLTNNEKAPFKGDDISWYGINGLFYNDGLHDGIINYYQMDKDTDGVWWLKNEAGEVFEVTSSGFDPDKAGAQQVTYKKSEEETGSVTLYGNKMSASEDGKTAWADFEITQTETLNVANVPNGTIYVVTEQPIDGYEPVSIAWEITKNVNGSPATEAEGPREEAQDGDPVVGLSTITGTIVVNRDNWVTYKNRRDEADLEIIKVDKTTLDEEEKVYLKDAEFTITLLDDEGHGEYAQAASTDDPTQMSIAHQDVVVTGDDGHITISRIQPGFYEIRETGSPAGYHLDPQPVYIKVYKGIITRIVKATDDDNTPDIDESFVKNWLPSTDESETIRFAAAQAATVDNPDTDEDETQAATLATLTVGNEAGAELPAAGGTGTTLYTLLGVALVAGAALWLARESLLVRSL